MLPTPSCLFMFRSPTVLQPRRHNRRSQEDDCSSVRHSSPHARVKCSSFFCVPFLMIYTPITDPVAERPRQPHTQGSSSRFWKVDVSSGVLRHTTLPVAFSGIGPRLGGSLFFVIEQVLKEPPNRPLPNQALSPATLHSRARPGPLVPIPVSCVSI